jgi:hypothetical protein
MMNLDEIEIMILAQKTAEPRQVCPLNYPHHAPTGPIRFCAKVDPKRCFLDYSPRVVALNAAAVSNRVEHKVRQD